MPAELFDARGDPRQHVAWREIDQPLKEIKPHAAHAGFIHPLQLGVGHLFADESDALGSAIGRFERVDHRAIVLGMGRGLHNHVLVEAEKIAQREQLFLRRVARRVFALRRVRKFVFRTEHMAMRINRARRRLELRLRRVGMERDIARRHRHGSGS